MHRREIIASFLTTDRLIEYHLDGDYYYRVTYFRLTEQFQVDQIDNPFHRSF